jgi:Glycosyltransferases involved in cell wall biogenesis
MKRISIVIPVYNVEQYLAKCLDSLLAQTNKDFKVIIVNDGSPDDCQDIIDVYVKEHPNFIYGYQKENGGLSDARNYGMQFVDTEFVLFIDSDDFVEPNLVEKVLGEVDEEVDMVVFDYNQYYESEDKKIVIHNGLSEGKDYFLSENADIMVTIKNAAWNKLYRSSLFIENHIEYPKGYRYEDLGTTFKLLLHTRKIRFLNIPLVNYLVDRSGNITTTYDKKIYDILAMVKVNNDYYMEEGYFLTYYEELKYITVRNVLECLKKTAYMSEREFVMKFIDDSFACIKKYFPDYRKTKYQLKQERFDNIYLNPFLCKLYYRYKWLWRKK